jgi:tetratricopeptide (TPR) repeat protein
MKHLERALKLNPNSADTLADASYLLAILGEPEQAIECAETAVRLNPHIPNWYIGYYAVALLMAHRHSEAIRVRRSAPGAFIDSPFFEAATLAHLGRLEEAKVAAEMGMEKLAATPGGARAITEGRVVELLLENNPYFRQEDWDHFAEGMRKAGIPG